MGHYITNQSIFNRLGLDKGVELGLDFDGEFEDGEILESGLGAQAEVLNSNNPWVKVRMIGSLKFQYNDDLTGDTSGKVGTLLFSEDTFLNELIDEAEHVIEDITGKKFGDDTLTDTKPFDVYDGQTDFWLGKEPIVSIDTITYSGQVVTWVENTDYWLYADMGLIKVVKGKVVSGNPKNLIFGFTYGDPIVPPGIKGITREMVVNVFDDYQRQRNLGGADEMSMADFRVKFVKRPLLTPELETRLENTYRTVNMQGM